MNKSTIKRLVSFLPKGVPKNIRAYDNNGESIDRYTVVFTGRYRGEGWFQYLAMNSAPFHPQGFGQHGESQTQIDVNNWGFAPAMGRKCHLGKRIPFSELPPDCQKLVMRDYRSIWELPTPLEGLGVKLHPARFSAMSPKMASIVAFIIGQEWVTPSINGLTITSDGFVLASAKGDVGYNHFIGGKDDLQRNWGNMLCAATDLATDELQLAEKLFAEKVKPC